MVRFQMPDPLAAGNNANDNSDESVGHRRSSLQMQFLLDDDDVVDNEGEGEDDDVNKDVYFCLKSSTKT